MSEHMPLTEAETACLDCGHPARLHWPVLGGVFDGCLGMVGERSCRCPVARAPHDTSERRKARYWRNVRRDAVEEGYIDERRVANLAARTSTATADDGLRERVANLHALTEGRNREGTSRWPECCRDTYSLAIEEAIAALDATAAPTTDTGARDE